MANLKLRIEGVTIKEATINSDWEQHLLNSTLHPYFANEIDGVSINKIKLISIGSAITIGNDSVVMNVGDEILMTDMDAGQVFLIYNHGIASSSVLEYQAIGNTTFNIKITFNSIV